MLLIWTKETFLTTQKNDLEIIVIFSRSSFLRQNEQFIRMSFKRGYQKKVRKKNWKLISPKERLACVEYKARQTAELRLKLSLRLLVFLVVPTFDTKVTEYLCSGWVFFLQTNFDFLTSHFWQNFSKSFESNCCPVDCQKVLKT